MFALNSTIQKIQLQSKFLFSNQDWEFRFSKSCFMNSSNIFLVILLYICHLAAEMETHRQCKRREKEKPRGIRILQFENTDMVGMLCTSVTSWHLICPVLSYLLFISENTSFYLLMNFCLRDITCIGNILAIGLQIPQHFLE